MKVNQRRKIKQRALALPRRAESVIFVMIFQNDSLGPGSFRAVKGPFVHVQTAERCTFFSGLCASLPMHPATVHHELREDAHLFLPGAILVKNIYYNRPVTRISQSPKHIA